MRLASSLTLRPLTSVAARFKSLALCRVDIALAAVHASAGGVEAVGTHLAADVEVTGRTDLHPVSALHLHAAHAHTGAFGGADDVDAPGLHGAEQARVDALVLVLLAGSTWRTCPLAKST